MISVKNQCLFYICASVVTIILMLSHAHLPTKKEVIHPASDNIPSLYADESWGGKSTAVWISPSTHHWRCNLIKSDTFPVCGIAISFQNVRGRTKDFSPYDTMVVSMNYSGNASKIRLYIRNHNPLYSNINDVDSLKFNSLVLRASDFKTQETAIALSEFSVSDWWVDERDIPRHHAHPEMTNVVAIGADFPTPPSYGQHDIEIKEVRLEGKWISEHELYFFLLCFWVALIMCHAGALLYFMQQRNYGEHLRIQAITRGIGKGSPSSKERSLSSIDPLTGIYNREGLAPTIDAIFNQQRVIKRDVVILLFDIDGLDRINKHKGVEMGDLVIREIANLVKMSIRSHDIVARWSGEEFILISTHTEIDAGRNLAEKIRSMVQNHTFKEDKSLNFTVSIGLTAVKEGETFEDSFMRANDALMTAKNAGKNSVIIL